MKQADYERLQRVVEVGDRFVSYVDQGTGPTVVLLHGMPTWGYLWNAVIPGLARGHRVLVPDLLGFGRSDRADRFDRSLPRQVDALLGWLDQLGVERATFVGHDVGGGVAQRIAVGAPERVERLCLVNSVGHDSWPIQAMLQLGDPKTARTVSAAALNRLLRVALRRGFARRPDEALIGGLLAPYATEVGKLSLVRNAAALDTSHTMEIVSGLGRLRMPVLLIWGERDPFQPISVGERLADDIPGSELARLDAGHFVMLDRPHEVEERIVTFVRARPAAPRGRPAQARPQR